MLPDSQRDDNQEYDDKATPSLGSLRWWRVSLSAAATTADTYEVDGHQYEDTDTSEDGDTSPDDYRLEGRLTMNLHVQWSFLSPTKTRNGLVSQTNV